LTHTVLKVHFVLTVYAYLFQTYLVKGRHNEMDFVRTQEQWRGVFRNLKKGYISGAHFQKCSNVSVFFTILVHFTPRGRGARAR